MLRLPPGFEVLATSDNSPFAAVRHDDAADLRACSSTPRWCTPRAAPRSSRNFVHGICGCARLLDDGGVHRRGGGGGPRSRSGRARAVCGLSGGVDSSVAAALVHRAIGERLTCIFVDHGLMRERRARARSSGCSATHLGMRLVSVDASARFLGALRGVADPEKKRRSSATSSSRSSRRRPRSSASVDFLVQGTLYPDVIESVSVRGPSATIKTHHNVGGLPERMRLKLVEPLRELFKDEVREVGRELGLPETMVGRHPFPGPGLAVRVLGEVTRGERWASLRRADAILIEELRRAGLYDAVWQAFAVLLPVRTVGVEGDARTYDNVLALRCVILRGRDDRGLVAAPARVPRPRLDPHHERGEGREPRRVRRLVEAARHDRVGVTRALLGTPPTPRARTAHRD